MINCISSGALPKMLIRRTLHKLSTLAPSSCFLASAMSLQLNASNNSDKTLSTPLLHHDRSCNKSSIELSGHMFLAGKTYYALKCVDHCRSRDVAAHTSGGPGLCCIHWHWSLD